MMDEAAIDRLAGRVQAAVGSMRSFLRSGPDSRARLVWRQDVSDEDREALEALYSAQTFETMPAANVISYARARLIEIELSADEAELLKTAHDAWERQRRRPEREAPSDNPMEIQ